MRFFHTADWHLGAPQHPQIYKERALDELFKLAREHNVDSILAVGDIFDRPSPNQVDKDFLLKKLLENPDIQVLFTIGNHDFTTKLKNYHSLNYLILLEEKLPNVRVFGYGFHEFDDSNLLVLDDDFAYDKSWKCDKPLVVCYHGIVPGVQIDHLSEEYRCESINQLFTDLSPYYVALGDIHKRIKFDERCYYSGTLVQKTYGCQDSVILVEPDKVTHLSIPLPKKVNIETKNILVAAVVQEVERTVKQGDFVKIKFSMTQDMWSAFDKESLISQLSGFVGELKLENLPPNEQMVRRAEEKSFVSMEEELGFIADKNKYFGLDKEKLMKKVNEYI